MNWKLTFLYFLLAVIGVLTNGWVSAITFILFLLLMLIDFTVVDKYVYKKQKEIEDKVKPKQI